MLWKRRRILYDLHSLIARIQPGQGRWKGGGVPPPLPGLVTFHAHSGGLRHRLKSGQAFGFAFMQSNSANRIIQHRAWKASRKEPLGRHHRLRLADAIDAALPALVSTEDF